MAMLWKISLFSKQFLNKNIRKTFFFIKNVTLIFVAKRLVVPLKKLVMASTNDFS